MPRCSVKPSASDTVIVLTTAIVSSPRREGCEPNPSIEFKVNLKSVTLCVCTYRRTPWKDERKKVLLKTKIISFVRSFRIVTVNSKDSKPQLGCQGVKASVRGVWSLRNVTISVPRAVLSGAAATLRCSYDLEGAPLYSIRWYRAETEFYRYVPREMPPHLVFPLPGASVDLASSDSSQVRVAGLHRRLSGEYQCEVSADAPLFHTDIRSAHLTVVESLYLNAFAAKKSHFPSCSSFGSTPVSSTPSIGIFGVEIFGVEVSSSMQSRDHREGEVKLASKKIGCSTERVIASDPIVASRYIRDPPFRAPQLAVERFGYARGELLRANCSVDEAFPAPNITWFLDDVKVKRQLTEQIAAVDLITTLNTKNGNLSIHFVKTIDVTWEITRPPFQIAEQISSWAAAEVDWRERPAFSQLEVVIEDGTGTVMGDSVDAERTRVSVPAPPGGQFSLKCNASIFDIYSRSSVVVTVREDAPQPASVTRDRAPKTQPSWKIAIKDISAIRITKVSTDSQTSAEATTRAMNPGPDILISTPHGDGRQQLPTLTGRRGGLLVQVDDCGRVRSGGRVNRTLYGNRPAWPLTYRTLTEYTREATGSVVVCRPVSRRRNGLVTPLGLRVSMGGDDRLLSGGSINVNHCNAALTKHHSALRRRPGSGRGAGGGGGGAAVMMGRARAPPPQPKETQCCDRR
ncbi:hypothetical protein EVAR_74408_1 [Eumeta japonica]|uniref:Ig-like domain-containing protein n=1 Tax=Eumeta variegata TaxID=151549 RepID=A0A4C1SG18_EUMVA|nr:hypothetical protein EVAR_74408_1 [Eumeta japonica]